MVIDLKNCTVDFVDGTSPTANKIQIKIGEGTISYDEKRPIQYIKDRGLLDEVRLGDQEPMDITMDVTWDHITSQPGFPITVEDALKQRNGASTWTSSDSDNCRPYALDIVINNEPKCLEDEIEVIVLPDFRYESINHDPKTGMLKITGKCNAQQAIPTYIQRTTHS